MRSRVNGCWGRMTGTGTRRRRGAAISFEIQLPDEIKELRRARGERGTLTKHISTSAGGAARRLAVEIWTAGAGRRRSPSSSTHAGTF